MKKERKSKNLNNTILTFVLLLLVVTFAGNMILTDKFNKMGISIYSTPFTKEKQIFEVPRIVSYAVVSVEVIEAPDEVLDEEQNKTENI